MIAAWFVVSLTFSLIGRTATAADFTFVQISDTHLNAQDKPDSPAGKLRDAFREIAELKQAPSFIIDTGDITESGTSAQFSAFQHILFEDLPKSIPLYVTPGNHDIRWNPPAGDAFLKEAGQPRYRSLDFGDMHFVLLDSTVPLEHWGHIDQEQLDWLAQDLQKNGRTRPVVICFHHWIGRDVGDMMVDNEDALLKLVRPYNIRLYLLGHGHQNLVWNVDGTPAIMTGALFDGSYTIIHVSGNHMDLYRRTKSDKAPKDPFMSIPLSRPASPVLSAKVNAVGGQLEVTLDKTDLPSGATVSCKLDGGKPVPVDANKKTGGYAGELPLGGIVAGVHRVLLTATLPDTRAYRIVVPLTLTGPGAIAPKWSVNLQSEIQGAALCDGALVFVPTMSGTLYALDIRKGTMIWHVATNGCLFAAPVALGEMLVFGSGDGNVYAVERKTGKPIWKSRLGMPLLSGLATAGSTLCVAGSDGQIYGLDAANGKSLWSAHGDGMFQSRPASDGSHFFLGDWGNGFRCLDAMTGKEVWKVKLGRSFAYSAAIGAPSLNADHTLVYVTSDDGVLHALDTQTGAERWKNDDCFLKYSGPTIANGVLYNAALEDLGHVYALDAATGAKIWTGTTGSVIYDSTCCVAGRDVCVGSVDGTFSALNRDTGAIDFQYRLGSGHLLASPIDAAGLVFIGTLGGQFAAFVEPGTPPPPVPVVPTKQPTNAVPTTLGPSSNPAIPAKPSPPVAPK